MTVKKDSSLKERFAAIAGYPAHLLAPVGSFLKDKLDLLIKRQNEIDKDDPFSDTSRVMDNASPDTEAAEQFGHAKSTALANQIQRNIVQIRKALARVKIGKYGICEDCGKVIDTDRLVVYPEATLCAKCAAKREK